MSMNDDISNYPVFLFLDGKLIKTDKIKSTSDYDHYRWHLHHFIEQSIRKNSPDFYKRVEHLQKLILMPVALNMGISNMSEKRFFETYRIEKHKILFSRKLWRSGVYD